MQTPLARGRTNVVRTFYRILFNWLLRNSSSRSTMLPIKVFLFGIDNAGKTALAKAMKNEKVIDTEPTINFDITKLVIKNLKFVVWDAPGQVKFRVAWKEGIDKAQVLLFLVDTTDETRFEEAKQELDKVLNAYETARVPLIFCFHKMDLPDAIANHDKAREIFKVPLIRNRKVFTFDTSIEQQETITAVKNQLADIIEKARWTT
jgi:small GTP-binding protein